MLPRKLIVDIRDPKCVVSPFDTWLLVNDKNVDDGGLQVANFETGRLEFLWTDKTNTASVQQVITHVDPKLMKLINKDGNVLYDGSADEATRQRQLVQIFTEKAFAEKPKDLYKDFWAERQEAFEQLNRAFVNTSAAASVASESFQKDLTTRFLMRHVVSHRVVSFSLTPQEDQQTSPLGEALARLAHRATRRSLFEVLLPLAASDRPRGRT